MTHLTTFEIAIVIVSAVTLAYGVTEIVRLMTKGELK